MASSVVDVEWQTAQIIKYLFEDEDEAGVRGYDQYETDGVDDPDDSFDPVLIGDKLRRVGDGLNEDAKFKEAMTDLKKAVAQETFDDAFSHCVDAVLESHIPLTAEVSPEVQLIKATVAFGLYVKKSLPELKAKLKNATRTFLSNRVGTWVGKQGGWDKVPGI